MTWAQFVWLFHPHRFRKDPLCLWVECVDCGQRVSYSYLAILDLDVSL